MKHPYLSFTEFSNQHEVERIFSNFNIVTSFKNKQNISVLDIGSGSGKLFAKIIQDIRKKFTIDAVDPDKEIMPLFLQTMEKLDNTEVTNTHSDTIENVINNLQKKYDLIFSGHSLYYSKFEIIDKLQSKLTDNGKMLLHMATQQSPSQRLFSIAKNKNGSEMLQEYLLEMEYKFTLYRTFFHVDITDLHDYLSGKNSPEGEKFFSLFVYNKNCEVVKQDIQNLINTRAFPINKRLYISGESRIFNIAKNNKVIHQ